jgi:HTH-type transcriptional repressor of NAD biosynthesis genes
MAGRDERYRDVTNWAGGGRGWEPDPSKGEPPPPPKPDNDPKPEQPEKDPKIFGATLGGTGVVCGRFLPVHRGHQYVIEVARGSVEDLLVLVFASPRDAISGTTRVRWLRELYPNVSVELVERDTSVVDIGELVRAVAHHREDPPRYFFASELAYAPAAIALGATFVPVDPTRAVFPTSGTSLRADVMRHFDMLPPNVRPWFARRVAVIGAESTGKSTLCAQLAAHYGTIHVPEYARTLAESRGGDLDADALVLAARGQLASEDALARSANRVLFCDTDVRTVAMWAERRHGEALLHPHAELRPYDLVMLTSLDEPFVGRADRDQPAARHAFHEHLRSAALASGARFVELAGDRAERFARATAEVDALLDASGFLAARAPHL